MSKKKKTAVLPAAPAIAPTLPDAPAELVTEVSFLDRRWIPELLLAVAAMLTFWPSLQHGFMSFDDGQTVYYNNIIQHPTLVGLLTSRIVGMYVPVSAFLYAGQYQLSGGNAFAFHLTSLVLHAAASIAAFAFLRQLRFSAFVSFFAALLFAVHPFRAEPVCWVAAQTTLVFSLFYLLSLISWVRYRQRNTSKWLIASLVFFLLSALSKSAAVTLPMLLPVIDWYLRVHKDGFNLRRYAYLLPFMAISVILGAYTFFTRTEDGATIAISNKSLNVLDRVLMISHTLLFYLYKLVLPFNLTISYPMVKEQGVWTFDYYIAPILVAGLIYLVYRSLSKGKVTMLGVVLYLLPLSIMLPLFSVGNFELRSDRYLYIPALGVFLLLVYFSQNLPVKLRWGLWLTVAAGYSFLGWQQSKFWKNDATCFQNCVDIYPNSVTCNCNLAYGELLTYQYQKSIDHYSRVLKMDVTCMECYNGRGQAYLGLRKIPEALADFDAAIAAGIITPKLFLNRGRCLVLLGRSAEALPDLNRSLELEPRSPLAHYFRAVAYQKTNAPEQAVADYTQALQLNPKYVEALIDRGMLHYSVQHYPEAIADLTQALQMAPPNMQAMILANRASAYLQSRQLEAGLADANQAMAMNAGDVRIYQIRAALYHALGRTAEAEADAQKMQQLQPGSKN